MRSTFPATGERTGIRARPARAMSNASSAARAMREEAGALVGLKVPMEVYVAGQFLKQFEQVSDKDVIKILAKPGSKGLRRWLASVADSLVKIISTAVFFSPPLRDLLP